MASCAGPDAMYGVIRGPNKIRGRATATGEGRRGAESKRAKSTRRMGTGEAVSDPRAARLPEDARGAHSPWRLRRDGDGRARAQDRTWKSQHLRRAPPRVSNAETMKPRRPVPWLATGTPPRPTASLRTYLISTLAPAASLSALRLSASGFGS